MTNNKKGIILHVGLRAGFIRMYVHVGMGGKKMGVKDNGGRNDMNNKKPFIYYYFIVILIIITTTHICLAISHNP